MTVTEKAKTTAAADKAKRQPTKVVGEAGPESRDVHRDVLVPLDRLVLSDDNVRKVVSPQSLVELAALIEAHGLLQRLCVVALPDDRFAVIAGGRRLRAMHLLAQEGRWSSSQPVECKVYASEQAVQVSLAENSGREAIHPADQMEAFRRLIEQEKLSVAQVADRFGVSPLTVERRLKLARLAPRFIALYRNDEIDPDQLQALALSEDPVAQEAIWDSLPQHDRSAWRIRNAITAESCNADSKLARFVGLGAYEAEGGTVRRDLFASAEDLSSIYLDNVTLLRTLAMDKLRGVAMGIQDEGWMWVDFALEADGATLRGYGREAQQEREPTAEEAQALEQLATEQRQDADAYDKHQDEGDPDAEDYELLEQQLCEALDVAEGKLDAARARLRHWSPEQMARAGALVRLDPRGAIAIDRGLLRPEDCRVTNATGRATMAEMAATGGAEVSAGHNGAPAARPEFSEKLMRDLTAHRTAAIQAALMQNPRIALVTLVHRMAESVFGLYGRGDDVVKVHVRVTGDSALAQDASDYSNSPAATLLGEAETQWGDRLPGSPPQVFRWLLAQPVETLLELLAYCTARSFNAVVSRERTFNHSDAVAEALGVDLSDWWTPSPANYVGSVSKTKALEAVREATGTDASKAVTGMKKPEVVAFCASKLEGARWLPGPLRSMRSPEHDDADKDE